MRAVSAPLPATDDTAPRAVLRDGSVVQLRMAAPSDHQALTRFFHELSPESRRLRFFAFAEPSDELLTRFCDSSDLSRNATLLALRLDGGDLRPIAVGSYFSTGDATAEAAFAVDDRFHGKGLGTMLLERLAAIAGAHGFKRFEATTLAENAAMLEVFHESGFEIRSKSDHGCVNVQLSIDPSGASVNAAERRDALATAASLRPLFEPNAVAVVGASRTTGSIGRRILRALVAGGFTGPVYPINPHADELDGVRCYPSLSAAPRGIDLAVVAVPRPAVLGVVDECATAGVKSLAVITAGFAETGADGRALQQALLDNVRGHGLRMVGPNCMGLLNANPRVRLNASFSPIVPPSGGVALSSQSGALGLAILELASERGVGLSTFVSVGNKADVSGNDLLQYWEADPATNVILLYLESFGNTRRFARLARRISRKKPIVALKAGRTRAGSRAAGSHTAALAASDTAVDALFRQSGVIRADTIDEMFDVPPASTRNRCLRAAAWRSSPTQVDRAFLPWTRVKRLDCMSRRSAPRHASGSPLFFQRRPVSGTRWTWWRLPVPRNTAALSRSRSPPTTSTRSSSFTHRWIRRVRVRRWTRFETASPPDGPPAPRNQSWDV